MESLSLDAEALTRFVEAPQIHSRLHNIRDLLIECHCSNHPNAAESSRYQSFCEQLLSCACLLPSMVGLKAFSLRITPSRAQDLWPKTNILMSLPNSVTSLTIDVVDPLGPSVIRVNWDTHDICHLLLNANILPCLRHLHIRSTSLCPKIFEVLNLEGRVRLETLFLNLAHYIPGVMGMQQTRLCGPGGGPTSKKGLLADMMDAAKIAAVRNPETSIRVIHVKLPSFQRASFNPSLNRQALIPTAISWDDSSWNDDGFTDPEFEVQEQTDVDLFEDSSSDSEPFIILNS